MTATCFLKKYVTCLFLFPAAHHATRAPRLYSNLMSGGSRPTKKVSAAGKFLFLRQTVRHGVNAQSMNRQKGASICFDPTFTRHAVNSALTSASNCPRNADLHSSGADTLRTMAGTSHRFSSPRRVVGAGRKPAWLKTSLPQGAQFEQVQAILDRSRLSTVCRSARCPNQSECWSCRTATFLLMGAICTRACRFCHVTTGKPLPLAADEPARLARAVTDLGLRHVVLTSVDRDDLPDGGADHFARCIEAIRAVAPAAKIEALIPDFGGEARSLDRVAEAKPDVLGHNIETVERLSPAVRDARASYRRSLEVLAHFRRFPAIHTKSSLMLGLGETDAEIEASFDDLRDVGTSLLTLGQYLQPSPFHLEVERFVAPEAFERLKTVALSRGFVGVAAGPMVRSSYRAGALLSGSSSSDDAESAEFNDAEPAPTPR